MKIALLQLQEEIRTDMGGPRAERVKTGRNYTTNESRPPE